MFSETFWAYFFIAAYVWLLVVDGFLIMRKNPTSIGEERRSR